MSTRAPIVIQREEVLAHDWGLLKKTTFAYQRSDGTWALQTRETYDRGNGATILLYNAERKTILLTRQFRFPAYVNGHSGWLIEACAGLLERDDAEEAIQRETEEEIGYRIALPTKLFEAYMSPGSVTERLAFFIASYEAAERVTGGGGVDEEDIEVLEFGLDEALSLIDAGVIMDGKTIILLYFAKLHHLLE